MRCVANQRNLGDYFFPELLVLYGIYVLPHYIYIISTDQKLLCPISFQYNLVFLDLPNGVF
jgi:hypothetical protein